MVSALAGCIGGQIWGGAAEAPPPGGAGAAPGGERLIGLQRLNRLQYDNTVRDLLATNLAPASAFPADPAVGGFDNNAEALVLDNALLGLYSQAAADLSAAALNPGPRWSAVVEAPSLGGSISPWDRWGALLHFKGMASVTLPADDTVVVTLSAAGSTFGGAPTPTLSVQLDGTEVGSWPVSAPTSAMLTLQTSALALGAGSHTLTLSNANGVDDPGRGYGNPLVVGQIVVASTTLAPAAGRAALYVCDPAAAAAADIDACWRRIVGHLGERAWRRPLTAEESDRLWALFTAARQGGSGDAALGQVIEAVLTSVNFLYRPVAVTGDRRADGTAMLTGLSLASRLASFLWGSMPDADLIEDAQAGRLATDAGLRQAVLRMLADVRIGGLLTGFVDQWLFVRQLQTAAPDAALFPNFDSALRQAMAAEAEETFADFLRSGEPVASMLAPDFVYVNDRLATHYGRPPPNSATMVRQDAKQGDRRGLLAQGGWLTATSAATRTSPVRRGRFIMEQLLCHAMAPPPGGVPSIGDSVAPGSPTVRQQLEAHSSDPACAPCHVPMNGLGLALEGYDAVGAVRTMEAGAAVDTSGALLDGQLVHGADDMAEKMRATPGTFTSCVSRQLLTYAVGRTLQAGDDSALAGIDARTAAAGGRLDELLVQIVLSDPFRREAAP